MTLKEILELCWDRDSYPDVIKYTDGSDIELPGYTTRAKWIEGNKPRRITLEITSFVGDICAMHYYGNLSAEGISFSINDNLDSYISDNNTRKIEKDNPLAASNYRIEMVRPLTQREIDKHPSRWKWMHEGSLTNSYESLEDVKQAAIEICKARFEGNWELLIRDHTSDADDILIKL